MGARHIVLACSKDILWEVLNQAQQIGLVTQQVGFTPAPSFPFQFNWILTNLDAHTVDFRPFKYDFTNFTLLRLLDFSRPFVQHSLRSIVTEVSSVSPCLHPCLHQGDHHGPNTGLH